MLILACEKLQFMKSYFYSLLILLFLNPLLIEAQTDVKIPKRDFKTVKEGFKDAWSSVSLGNKYFRERSIWYGSAYEEYRRALAYNNANPELNYKTGVAALYSDNKDEAANYLLKAFEQDSGITDDIQLMTGRALQYAGRYGEAVTMLNNYLNSDVPKTKKNVADASKYLAECNSALEVINDTISVDIQNAGSNLNSFADDYSLVFSHDFKTMFFASRREVARSVIALTDGKFDENIFYSTRNGDNWDPASPVTGSINTSYCETPLCFDPSGEEMYIYAGYQNGGDIKLSVKKNGIWKSPVSAPFNINTRGSETSITFSPDGNEVWFVTDKGKNSLGGKDIYYIRKTPKNKWTEPVNPGSVINTPWDEESVRFSDLGDTLFFGSKGHNSIGGYDIFYSVKDSSGVWKQAVNCGYPVNTPWEELFYVPDRNKKGSFWLASDRKGTTGGLDIYYGKKVAPPIITEPEPIPPAPPDTVIHRLILETPSAKPDPVVVKDTVVIIREVAPVPEKPEEIVLYLAGRVQDSESGDPVLAKVDIIDISTDMVLATTASSDIDGSYRIRLPEKKSYMADFRGTGFLPDLKKINIPEDFKGDVYTLNVDLVKVKVGKKVVLNNILFQTGKAVLTTGSFAELDRLIVILQENPLMRIEISGHTDNTGTLALNTRLSQERAKAVVDYLIEKGIDPARLEFKGYGPQQPLADNKTAEGRAVNRRVEFKILEF